MKDLPERRRKILDLFAIGKISMELLEEEEQRLTLSVEAARSQASQSPRTLSRDRNWMSTSSV